MGSFLQEGLVGPDHARQRRPRVGGWNQGYLIPGIIKTFRVGSAKVKVKKPGK
jgi:hypothetical protein